MAEISKTVLHSSREEAGGGLSTVPLALAAIPRETITSPPATVAANNGGSSCEMVLESGPESGGQARAINAPRAQPSGYYVAWPCGKKDYAAFPSVELECRCGCGSKAISASEETEIPQQFLLESREAAAKLYTPVLDLAELARDARPAINPNQAILSFPSGRRIYALGLATAGVQVMLLSDGRAVEIPLPTKEAPNLTLQLDGQTFPIRAIMLPLGTQITAEGLRRFGRRERINPAAHYARGIELLNRYVEMHSIEAGLYVAWLQSTYWTALAGSIAYPYFGGKPGTGKSTAMKFGALVAYKGDFSVSPTPAVIYRLVDQGMATLFLDELDKLDKETAGPIMALLNAGYSMGAVVRRCEPTGPNKAQAIREFAAYSGKACAANEYATLDSLRSRLLEITMQPALRKLRNFDARAPDETGDLERWRDDCWLLALQEWAAYEAALREMNAQAQRSDRAEQLNAPLLATLKVLGQPVEEWRAALAGKSAELAEAVASGDWDAVLLEILFNETNCDVGKLTTSKKELAGVWQKRLIDEGLMPAERTISAQKLGLTLKKLGLQGGLERSRNRRMVTIVKSEVVDAGLRFPALVSQENADFLRALELAREARKSANDANVAIVAIVKTGGSSTAADEKPPNEPTPPPLLTMADMATMATMAEPAEQPAPVGKVGKFGECQECQPDKVPAKLLIDFPTLGPRGTHLQLAPDQLAYYEQLGAARRLLPNEVAD